VTVPKVARRAFFAATGRRFKAWDGVSPGLLTSRSCLSWSVELETRAVVLKLKAYDEDKRHPCRSST